MAFLISQVKGDKEGEVGSVMDTKMEEPRGALCSSVHPASSGCWQSNADLNVGRERRNGEVDKGPWKDACSATYGFAPEPATYSKATEKLAASILVP